MAEKNGFRRARTGRGVEALTARKSDVMARQAQAEAHISDQLNTFTLGGTEAASAENVSTISNPIHIQDENFAHLETMNTINEALFRSDAGPIPGTSVIETTTVSDETRTVLFTPGTGEVWRMNAAGALATNPSSATYTMYISNVPSGGSDILAFFYDDSDDGTVFFTDDENWGPYRFDENVRIEGTVGGSVTEANWQLNLYRIR